MAKVLVLYHSQEYGNTALMAKAVANGLENSGCVVDMFNTNDGRFDITKFPQYDGVAIGSPDYYSYIAGGLKMFMDDHYIYDVHKKLKGLRDKPFFLFYSHGGGGRVKEVMPRIFKRVGTLISEPVGSMGRPDKQVLNRCKALGAELVSIVRYSS
jgi:multimeric flavodoxin WrbA